MLDYSYYWYNLLKHLPSFVYLKINREYFENGSTLVNVCVKLEIDKYRLVS